MTTNQLDIDKYEEMTWQTPANVYARAVEELLAEVKRLRDIVCLLEDSRIRGLSIFDRPQLFDDVLQIHTQRNEQGNGDLPPFECVGEEE